MSNNNKIIEQNRINRILHKNGYFENFNWNYKKTHRDYNRLTVRQKGDNGQFKLEEMNIGLSTANFHFKLEFGKKTNKLRFAITLWKVGHDEIDKYDDKKIATFFSIRKARRFIKKGLIDFLIQKENEKGGGE